MVGRSLGGSLGGFAWKIRSEDSLGGVRSEDSLGRNGLMSLEDSLRTKDFLSLEEIVQNLLFGFEKGCFWKGSLKGFLLSVPSLRLSHATVLATASQSLTCTFQLHID